MQPGHCVVNPCLSKSFLKILKLRTSEGSSTRLVSTSGMGGTGGTPPDSTMGLSSCSTEGCGGSGASSSQGVPLNFKPSTIHLSARGRRLMVRVLITPSGVPIYISLLRVRIPKNMPTPHLSSYLLRLGPISYLVFL